MLYIDNENNIYLLGLTEESSGDLVTDASPVQVTLYESDGVTEISGESWPLAMSYFAGSKTIDGVTYPGGNYRGVLSDALVFDDDEKIVAHVEATKGANTFSMKHPDVARVRRSAAD